MAELPRFKYHPDPLTTGSLQPSDVACLCCRQARGVVYTASVYGKGLLRGSLCPWCIADGSAAEKFDVVFSDADPLLRSGVPDEIANEVTRRTPGFSSWQQEVWLSHCGDACEFHGDVPARALREMDIETQREIAENYRMPSGFWQAFVRTYEPGGNPAVYLFRCRHCGKKLYQLDFT